MKRGQVSPWFTYSLIGMLLIIISATIVAIIYVKSQNNFIYIIDNQSSQNTASQGIANATVGSVQNITEIPAIIIENNTIANATVGSVQNITKNYSIPESNGTTYNISINISINESINLSTAVPGNAELINGSCRWQLPYQDFNCSPGKIMTTNTTLVCTPGYATSVRNVSQSTKNKVYALYGVVNHTVGEWQVDHIIPLSLGGSNDITNLYPQPSSPYPGFYQKDRVEAYFYKEVCAGRMALNVAQMEIVNNWVPYVNTAIKNTNTPDMAAEGEIGDQIIG